MIELFDFSPPKRSAREEKMAAYCKHYAATHRTQINARKRRDYWRDPLRARAAARERYARNREHIAARRREKLAAISNGQRNEAEMRRA